MAEKSSEKDDMSCSQVDEGKQNLSIYHLWSLGKARFNLESSPLFIGTQVFSNDSKPDRSSYLKAWLGIDVGTSGVKAIVVDDSGSVLGRGESNYQEDLATEMHEQDPMGYLKAAADAVKECGTHPISGVGVVGQTPTLVMVDHDGKPTRKAITWRDMRANGESEILKNSFPASIELFGVDNLWESSQLASKLFWLSRNEPEKVAQSTWLLQPKDFVNMALTGIARSDVWSSKGFASVSTGKSVEKYFDFIGVNKSLVPPLMQPWESIGLTTSSAHELLGLPTSLPVAVGWSDALAGMIAIGAVTSPRSFILTGTSDIVGASHQISSDSKKGLYQVPQSAHSLTIDYGPTQSSGASLLWLSKISGKNVGELVELATQARESDIIFTPYLRGERAPIWNQDLRAAFTNLSDEDGLPEIAYAVMRGVALSDRHVLENSLNSGESIQEIHLAGANVDQSAWIRARNEVIPGAFVLHFEPQLPALGACMLARSAATKDSLHDSYHILQGKVSSIGENIHDLNRANFLYKKYLRQLSFAQASD